MKPEQLVGMPFRLGARPDTDGATDCANLCVAVLEAQGLPTPPVEAQRGWVRGLAADGSRVFFEALAAWGDEVVDVQPNTVALHANEDGSLGLAICWEDGWLAGFIDAVRWVPLDALRPVVMYRCKQ